MKTYLDISYAVRETETLCLDVYAPEQSARATLLWMHGGALEKGSRKRAATLAAYLCEQGVAVISADYRLFPNAAYPDFLVDTADAARWMKDHVDEYDLPSRFLLGGNSAGAYLTMMMCFDRRWLAGVDMVPEEFDAFLLEAGQPTAHQTILKYRGMDLRRVLIDDSAVLYHIQDQRPDRPLLITVSDNDLPCRLEQNRLMEATLKHFEYDMSKVEFHVMEGYGHCGYTYDPDDSGRMVYGELVRDFLNRHLWCEKA